MQIFNFFAMQKISALFKKELRLYFNSPIAYIFLLVFYSFSSWLFFRSFFLIGQNTMRSFFDFLPWTYLFLIPSLTMRLWAEEYRQGTIETLLTSSVSAAEAVIAKYLSAFSFLLIVLTTTLIIPISLSFIGGLDWGLLLASYIAALLLGSSFIALGALISSLTNNQIVAFIFTVIFCFLFFILGEPIVIFSIPGNIASIFEVFALGSHYGNIIRGVLDLHDLVYFLSFILVCLFFNLEILKSKK